MKSSLSVVLFIFCVIVFSQCAGQKSKESNRHVNENAFHIVKDTVINGYHTTISMRVDQLNKGSENEIEVKVDGIQSDQILLYTKVSEATVKVGKKPSCFLILPTEKVGKVNLNINTEENGKIVKVGVISLRVK